MGSDELDRLSKDVQKATDETIAEIDQTLAQKEKEILSV
jgi:ribosome recycling factor